MGGGWRLIFKTVYSMTMNLTWGNCYSSCKSLGHCGSLAGVPSVMKEGGGRIHGKNASFDWQCGYNDRCSMLRTVWKEPLCMNGSSIRLDCRLQAKWSLWAGLKGPELSVPLCSY